MLKQIVVKEKMILVKHQGKVKYLELECNFCHRHFDKQESYVRKQSRMRKSACCFCSIACRLNYYKKDQKSPNPSIKSEKVEKKQIIVEKSEDKKDTKKRPPITTFLRKFFGLDY